MNRLFDDFSRGSGLLHSGRIGCLAVLADGPISRISETDKEVKVTAELPGLEEKDIEVELANGVLIIKGEKRTETEDKDRLFSERYYGRFERRIPVDEVEEDKVSALFKNGVLTITLPKSAKAQEKVKRIGTVMARFWAIVSRIKTVSGWLGSLWQATPADIPLGVGVKRHLVKFEYYFFWSPLTQTVRFYARHGDSRIRCGVTRTSHEDLAQSSDPLHPRDLERAFEEHRQAIERIAAEKILAGHFQGDGTVLIRTVDLNP